MSNTLGLPAQEKSYTEIDSETELTKEKEITKKFSPFNKNKR